jgi:enoyl-[acyl-carrier protein] reductase I
VSFLGLEGKTIVVFGVANKKSVAWHAAKVLEEEGARVVYSVRSEARREALLKLAPGAEVHVADVAERGAVERVAAEIGRAHPEGIAGLLHSIAFARYSDAKEGAPLPAFHETPRDDFLAAVQVSCHSLLEIARAMKPLLTRKASIVTVSISTTSMAAENYGYMAPIKAALDSSVVFLAKSFSGFSEVRVNAVCPSLLKTVASAGIPGYAESYLFAERATLRKRAVETREVANAIAFLLSERSSGINAQRVVIDAGMGSNYFDREIVARTNGRSNGAL